MKGLILSLIMSLGASCALGSEGDETVIIKGIQHHKGLVSGKVEGARYLQMSMSALPDSYDAVASDKATPVKGNGQGSCGDCWAWARTSSLEAAILASGKPALALSEEDTTDNAQDEYGCGGGMMDFNYEMDHGVASLAVCPWRGGGQYCDSIVAAQGSKMAFIGASSRGPTADEMKAAIWTYGSVAVTVAAAGNFDVANGSDRMTSCYATGIDHMVSLVGWRPTPDGKNVEFKMKNSWGTAWGANGYAYMVLGCNEIATGDQSAMVITLGDVPVPPIPPTPPTPPTPPAPVTWTCSVKPLFGSSIYKGSGASQSEATDSAQGSCYDDGHWVCRLQTCQST